MNYIVFFNKNGKIKLVAQKKTKLNDNEFDFIDETCKYNNYVFMCYKNIDDLKVKNIPIIFLK